MTPCTCGHIWDFHSPACIACSCQSYDRKARP